jgi:hypothetical protein
MEMFGIRIGQPDRKNDPSGSRLQPFDHQRVTKVTFSNP